MQLLAIDDELTCFCFAWMQGGHWTLAGAILLRRNLITELANKLTSSAEEVSKDGAALLGKQAGDHLDLVVELRVVHDGEH